MSCRSAVPRLATNRSARRKSSWCCSSISSMPTARSGVHFSMVSSAPRSARSLDRRQIARGSNHLGAGEDVTTPGVRA